MGGQGRAGGQAAAGRLRLSKSDTVESMASPKALGVLRMITILVVLILLGLVVWVANQLPIDPTFKRIIYVVAVVFAVLYLLQAFGLIAGLGGPVPRLR